MAQGTSVQIVRWCCFFSESVEDKELHLSGDGKRKIRRAAALLTRPIPISGGFENQGRRFSFPGTEPAIHGKSYDANIFCSTQV